MHRRVLIVGLDGVSFKTIIQGIENNELPVIARLKKEGYMSRMQSHYLPTTSESIGCFITGKNPGKTGLFGWYRYENGEPKQITSADWSNAFWEYLNRYVVVIGLPLTYPAKPIKGILVGSAHFSVSLERFTFPQNVLEIAKKDGYVPLGDIYETSDILRATAQNLLAQERLASQLLASTPWELAIVYFQQTDIVSHALDMVSSAVSDGYSRSVMLGVLHQIDGWIGQLLSSLGNTVDLILFSDHGGTFVEYLVNSNKLLEEAGLFDRSCRSRVYEAMWFRDKSRIHDTQKIPREGFTPASSDAPDGLRTLLYVSERAANRVGLRVLHGNMKDIRFRKSVKLQLEKIFSTLVDSHGRRLIRNVRTSNEVYFGQRLEEGPHYLVEFEEAARDSGDFDSALVKKRSFGHEIDGFMLCHLRNSEMYSESSFDVSYRMYDIAATILALFGTVIPDDFDGRPFATVSKTHRRGAPQPSDRWKEEQTEKRGLTAEEEESILRRLKQLGYV